MNEAYLRNLSMSEILRLFEITDVVGNEIKKRLEKVEACSSVAFRRVFDDPDDLLDFIDDLESVQDELLALQWEHEELQNEHEELEYRYEKLLDKYNKLCEQYNIEDESD